MSDSSSSDAEYDDEEPEEPQQMKGRQTLLNRLWPKISKYANKKMQPAEIAEKLNKNLESEDQVTGRQISGKIGRMKSQGRFRLSVNTSGSQKASNPDCMHRFLFLVLVAD
jgi:hypothetical protein